MLKNIITLGRVLASHSNPTTYRPVSSVLSSQILHRQFGSENNGNQHNASTNGTNIHLNGLLSKISASYLYQIPSRCSLSLTNYQPSRGFHAKNSKVHYLDFRHRYRVDGKKLHLLIIRRKKMKNHRRRKWRKKFKAMLAKQRLTREIAKEKAFRVELLSMIRLAENFDPREYALKKINEINNRPRERTKAEKLEELKELIRQNRHEVDYVKPKHRKADI